MELDKNVLKDLSDQISSQEKILKKAIEQMDKDISNNECFVECGQIADRLYGAISMLDFKTCSDYLKGLKELSYKIPNVDPTNFKLREKGRRYLKDFGEYLPQFLIILNKKKGHVELLREIDVELKKLDTFLSTNLSVIAGGSVELKDTRTYVYVYEQQKDIESSYKNYHKEMQPTPKFFNMYNGFSKALEKEIDSVSCVIIEINSASWEIAIRNIHDNHPSLPIILGAKNKWEAKNVHSKQLGVNSVIVNNWTYDKIEKVIKSLIPSILDEMPEETESIELPASTEKKEVVKEKIVKEVKEEITKTTPGSVQDPVVYVSISINTLKDGQSAPFEIFVKKNEEEYLKIINAFDLYDYEYVKNHVGKKIDKCFVVKSDFEGYVKNFDKQIEDYKNSDDINLFTFKTEVLYHSQKIWMFIEQNGIDERSIKSAKDIVEISGHIVLNLIEEKDDLIELFNNVAKMEHGLALCLMAGLFLHKMDASPQVHNDISLMCFLHDISLLNSPKATQKGNISLMNPKEKEKYYEHSEAGAKILEQYDFKAPLVDALRNHHYRVDGTGFPKEAPQGGLNPIGEFIGMCEEFVMEIQECVQDESDPVASFHEKKLGSFSQKIQSIFKKTWE